MEGRGLLRSLFTRTKWSLLVRLIISGYCSTLMDSIT